MPCRVTYWRLVNWWVSTSGNLCDRLLLNVNVGSSGETRLEVLDEGKKAISGFELRSRVPLRGDSTELPVRWQSPARWSQLARKKVRLRIQLRNGDLDAHRTEKEQR